MIFTPHHRNENYSVFVAHFQKEYIAQGGPGTEITDAIPSLDMRPVLALFSPEDAFLRIESCTACGGHLEIVTKETKRVARLTKRIRCGSVCFPGRAVCVVDDDNTRFGLEGV